MDLARLIDHTLLKPDAEQKAIIQLCEEALKHNFAAVCVPPYWVSEAARQLEKSNVKIATVIGFPMGYSATAAKVEEIKRSIDEGADELDVVINICAIKSGNWNYLQNDIDRTTTAVHLKGKQIKIIMETGLLTNPEIVKICGICQELEPDFVKTSTGFNGPGASVEVVQLLRQNLNDNIKIKASGGIRTREDAINLVNAGAQRLGSSSGVKIITELQYIWRMKNMLTTTNRLLYVLGLLIALCVVTPAQAQNIQVNEDPVITRMMERFAEINKSKTSVEGWRIQVLATTDRQKMEVTRQNFQYRYPNIPIDWVHSKPYYKLRAGAFVTKLEALRLKHILERDYSGIYLVKDDNIRPAEFINTYQFTIAFCG